MRLIANNHTQDALTLIETLVAMIILSLITIAYLSPQKNTLSHWTRWTAHQEAMQPQQDVMNLLSSDLRNLMANNTSHWHTTSNPSQQRQQPSSKRLRPHGHSTLRQRILHRNTPQPSNNTTSHNVSGGIATSGVAIQENTLTLKRGAWPTLPQPFPQNNDDNHNIRNVTYGLTNNCLTRLATDSNNPTTNKDNATPTLADGTCWLPNTTQLTFEILDQEGQWHDSWPASASLLPTALRITWHTHTNEHTRTFPIAMGRHYNTMVNT